jgi:AcrR family transcriptional regulator
VPTIVGLGCGLKIMITVVELTPTEPKFSGMQEVTEELRLALSRQRREVMKLYSLDLHPTASSILDEGARVIISGGGGALSMRAVAKAANIKLASLQYHFKTFDELVAALFSREFGRVIAIVWSTLERLEEELPPPAEALRRAAEAFMPAQYSRDNSEHRIYFHLLAFCSYNNEARSKAESFYNFYNTLFAYLVSKVNPRLTIAECRSRAIMITSALEGTGLYTILKVCGSSGERTCHREIGDLVVHYATRTSAAKAVSPAAEEPHAVLALCRSSPESPELSGD